MKVLNENYFYQTSSLTIRFYRYNDLQKWQKLFSEMNPKQSQWDWEIERVDNLTVDRFNNKLRRHGQERKDGSVNYFCVENKNGDLIGICLITKTNKLSAEIGFQLNNKYWDKGLGLEIARGIVDVCKNEFGISSVRALVNKNNSISIHILEKIGMKRIDENETQWILE